MIGRGTAPHDGVPQDCEGLRLKTDSYLTYVISSPPTPRRKLKSPAYTVTPAAATSSFMMAPQPATASQNPPNGPLPPPSHHHRSKSASETQRDEARVEFNKTIEGHYRHGKTGYRQVGALFLTWKDHMLQCREMEVDTLGAGLHNDHRRGSAI